MFSWKDLAKKGIISCLAPMEDVTDTVFRQLLIETGRPDVFFTEFTNLEGLFSVGYDNVAHRLEYEKNEFPLIAQVWGTTPELYSKGSLKIKEMGFSGIDVNMGCAVEKVIKAGACSALIKNMPLASKIINATKESVGDFPMSIKTRLGFDEMQIEEWLGFVLTHKPDVLTIHLRTVKELSKVPAHYEVMSEITKLRDKISPNTLLMCNGDIKSVQQGETLCKDNGWNGYMIGREAVNNPWVFVSKSVEDITKDERLSIATKHIEMYAKKWGDRKNFEALKKFLKRYITNFDGAKDLRDSIMNIKTAELALKLINEYK